MRWMYQGILTLYIPCLLTKKRRIKRWKSQKDAEWERVSDWEKERVRRKLKELRFSCVYHKNKNVNGGKPRSRSSFHEEVNDDCRIDISRCSFTGKKIVFSGVVAISDWTSLLFLSLFISLLFKEKRKKEKKKIFDKRYSDFVDDLLLKQ